MTKKLLIIAAILFLAPFGLSAREGISDELMRDFTGQAGVSIGFDLTLNIDIENLLWGDSDGLGGAGGWVGAVGLDIDGDNVISRWEKGLHIDNLRLRLPEDMAGNTPTYADGTPNPNYNPDYQRTLWDLELLTIDVAEDDTLYDGQAFVRIGLGTVDITMEHMGMNAGVAPDLYADDGTGMMVRAGSPDMKKARLFGVINLYNLQVLTGPGSRVDIFPHGRSGVTLDMVVIIDSITMAALSWGDLDGAGAVPIKGFTIDTGDYTEAGYVGFANVAAWNIVLQGQLLIDVATMDKRDIRWAPLSDGIPGSYMLYTLLKWLDDPLATAIDPATGLPYHAEANYISDTFVFIQIGDRRVAEVTDPMTGIVRRVFVGDPAIDLHIGEFAADVVVADNSALYDGAISGVEFKADAMGSVYMMNLNVNTSGWVAIFAH